MPETVQPAESLSNFAADPSRYLRTMRESGKPLVLTLEGQEPLVVLDASSYQRLVETVDRLETIAAVKEGLRDVDAGRVWPARKVLDEIARKHRLPATDGE
jgi:PHD/YefM family antitoxin component YafN of YafNO toxin-antitoxin module